MITRFNEFRIIARTARKFDHEVIRCSLMKDGEFDVIDTIDIAADKGFEVATSNAARFWCVGY